MCVKKTEMWYIVYRFFQSHSYTWGVPIDRVVHRRRVVSKRDDATREVSRSVDSIDATRRASSGRVESSRVVSSRVESCRVVSSVERRDDDDVRSVNAIHSFIHALD